MIRAALPFAAVACAAALVASLSAQQQPPQQQQPPPDLPRFTTEVGVTSLDVSVYDERGRPITDLKPSDFTVQVDGDRRQVLSAPALRCTKPRRSS